jgi:broad specificity phosphatase PhoE
VRLILIRHGESTWNVEGRYQGRRDAPLSPRGIAQAQALGPALAGFTGTFISSPLVRAHDTLCRALEQDDAPIVLDDRLTEIAHGEWEGLLLADVQARYPDLWRAWRETPQFVVFPGGESLAAVDARLKLFLRDVERTRADVIAATHDVVVRLAVLTAHALPLSDFNQVSVDNASLSEFDLTNGLLTAVRINVTDHLGSMRGDLSGQAL